jgi:hypothetical protein
MRYNLDRAKNRLYPCLFNVVLRLTYHYCCVAVSLTLSYTTDGISAGQCMLYVASALCYKMVSAALKVKQILT